MTIVRVQHIGIAVKDFQGTLNKFEKVYGLKARDFRDDQGKGCSMILGFYLEMIVGFILCIIGILTQEFINLWKMLVKGLSI